LAGILYARALIELTASLHPDTTTHCTPIALIADHTERWSPRRKPLQCLWSNHSTHGAPTHQHIITLCPHPSKHSMHGAPMANGPITHHMEPPKWLCMLLNKHATHGACQNASSQPPFLKGSSSSDLNCTDAHGLSTSLNTHSVQAALRSFLMLCAAFHMCAYNSACVPAVQHVCLQFNV